MPTVLAFLPCEKIVVEQGTNNYSIISVLDTLNVVVPASVSVPPKTYVPLSWTVLMLFQREESDPSGEYEAKPILEAPDGEVLIGNEMGAVKWQWTTPRQRCTVQIDAFPIWKPGNCTLRLMVKSPGSQDFDEILRTVVTVAHVPEPAPGKTP